MTAEACPNDYGMPSGHREDFEHIETPVLARLYRVAIADGDGLDGYIARARLELRKRGWWA